MPSGLKVNIRTTVEIQKIQKLADQGRVQILVGFPSGREHVPTLHKNKEGNYQGYDGEDPTQMEPIETAELAKELSYGTATIPARPFLEEGIKSKENEILKTMQEEATKLKNTGKANWMKVGTMAVGAVQEFVRSDYYKQNVPNAQKTIDYKGSDTPLIDGGDLINSVTFLVNGVEGK